MRSRETTNPITFVFLVLPFGISSGFASITLPFILTRAGFSVATAASIVALGVSSNLWRFLWGPVADLTLSARRWYLIGLSASVATLLVLAWVPFRQETIGLLSVMVFISQVAGTLVVLPVGGLMAHTVDEKAKGRAAGWFQAGNLGGNGIGGGVGVWLAAHFSKQAAIVGLAGAMLLSAFALYFVSDVRLVSDETVAQRMRLLGRDIVSMLRSAVPLFIIVLIISPIGSGAMNNLWSAVAPDWHAGPDTVAFVTGILNGVVAAVGCVIGGWIADRVGRWWAYFGSGAGLAAIALLMVITPQTPSSYVFGVLTYALFNGLAYAAFSALVLFAIGRGAASTKYATLSSLGNIPIVYMTALNGWVHDRLGTAEMLEVEALSAVICIVLAFLVLQKIKTASATTA